MGLLAEGSMAGGSVGLSKQKQENWNMTVLETKEGTPAFVILHPCSKLFGASCNWLFSEPWEKSIYFLGVMVV